MLVHVLTRIERGAAKISGTVIHPLAGSASIRSSATGALTQTRAPVTHHVTLTAAEVKVTADIAAVHVRHIPTVLEKMGGPKVLVLLQVLAMVNTWLSSYLQNHYGRIFAGAIHILHWLRVLLERRLH